MSLTLLNPSDALSLANDNSKMAPERLPSMQRSETGEPIAVNQEQIDTVRSGLKPEHIADDATVARFVRATNGNLKESIKRLKSTCDWRAKAKPEEVVCKACAKNSRSHYMHVVGHDLLGRPIIYSCVALAENKVYEDNRDHMIQTFETAIKCMPEGVEQWVWVCDFHGFGMSDALNVKIAKAFLEISAAHYPERLGQFVLLDAPPVFSMLWKAIKSLVDPKTYAKIRFVPYDVKSKQSELVQSLKANFDDTTAAWLLREVTENRDKAKIKQKRYDVGHIHKAASAGQLQGLCTDLSGAMAEVKEMGEARTSPLPLHHSHSDDGDFHDHRGTCSLLQMYHEKPAILEPQGRVMRGKQ